MRQRGSAFSGPLVQLCPPWPPEAAPKHPSSGPRILGLEKLRNRTSDYFVSRAGLLNLFVTPQTLLASSEVQGPHFRIMILDA